MDHYVLGFIFSYDLKQVLLVNKRRPGWQEGKWNGIGGHIEKEEQYPYPAMKREIREEVDGLLFDPTAMEHRVTFTCPGGTVWVYKAMALRSCLLSKVKSKTDEPVEWFRVERIGERPDDALDSIRWLVPLMLSDVRGPILIDRTKKSV
jgi:8-oxo-dGTP pyrophosphatase MutT (NUDIX family)